MTVECVPLVDNSAILHIAVVKPRKGGRITMWLQCASQLHWPWECFAHNRNFALLSCFLTKTLVWEDFEPDHISYSHSHPGSLLQQGQICITIVKLPNLCFEAW